MKKINSLDNKKIKELIKLKKANIRKELGVFLVDGFREVSMALEAGLEIRDLFYCPSLDKKNNLKALKIKNDDFFEVPELIFNKISYKENPDGFLGVIEFRPEILSNISLNKNPLVIILDNIEKPGNLGAIIRTAYAAGVDLIIINNNQTDVYNPNVIRASEGLIFKQKLVSASFQDTVVWLKKNKITSYGAAITSSVNYTTINMKKPLALVLGSEADGLGPDWLNQTDKLIKIPMKKGMDSLNVSVSAAILLYEAVRQRNK